MTEADKKRVEEIRQYVLTALQHRPGARGQALDPVADHLEVMTKHATSLICIIDRLTSESAERKRKIERASELIVQIRTYPSAPGAVHSRAVEALRILNPRTP